MGKMNIIKYPPKDSWQALLVRPKEDQGSMDALVQEVFENVGKRGDTAVLEYTRLYDKVALDTLRLERTALREKASALDPGLKEAIDMAYGNIEAFHKAQRTDRVSVETRPGVLCWQEKKPLEKVGIYIPGGSAPLFSTVLMLALPARIAGCPEIVLCSPPGAGGTLHPAICYAALKCGVTTVCMAGGIQAIAALTLGTESIPAVHKIFGPGNQYVTQAKQWATRMGVAIDMPAGPSELLVVADTTAQPEFIAADLLSQAEHGPDSQVLLLTDNEALPDLVNEAISRQLRELPRQEIAAKALGNSRAILLRNREELCDMVNAYAPEHLIIAHREEAFLLEGLRHAGSVFLGNYTPESAGDYASGTNHTLPTNGYARQYSGVNLDHYTKAITYQRISAEGIRGLGPAIETMAAAEGLEAHRNAVTLRLQYLENEGKGQ